MPTTRSSSANRSPQAQRNLDLPKSPKKSPRKSLDAVDNVPNEQLISCKKCSNPQKMSNFNVKEQQEIQDAIASGGYWLCENCYSKLSKDDRSICFLRISNRGGLFDPSADPSISQRIGALYDSLCEIFDTTFSTSTIYISVPTLVILISCFYYWYFVYAATTNQDPKTKSIDVKIEESFKELERKFPEQDDTLWANFASGFSDIATNDSIAPAVFLILHSNNTKTLSCIVDQVCNLAHKILNVAPTPVELDGVNLINNKYSEYGDFIVDIKPSIQSQKISVVKNLHKVPGLMAPAFHGLTDAYHPLVEKVIYLMSIPMNESHHSSSVFEFAEESLKESWRDVKEEFLGPLVTRLTNSVVQIKDENNFPDYC